MKSFCYFNDHTTLLKAFNLLAVMKTDENLMTKP